MEPKKGKWGLWYVGSTGFATKEQAEQFAKSGEIDTGIEIAKAPSHNEVRSSSAVALLLVGVVVAVAAGYWLLTSGDARPTECGDETMAYVMSQNFVKRQLRSPGGADFPTMPTAKSVRTGECSFSVVSYVDAQNGFGAMIRSNYTATMTYHPDTKKWTSEGLTILGR